MTKTTQELVKMIVTQLEDAKALDIDAIDISSLTIITDCFILATGRSDTHVKSVSDRVYDEMRDAGYPAAAREGYRQGKWVAIDFGDVVVHVFGKEEREFYSLERLWSDGITINVDNL